MNKKTVNLWSAVAGAAAMAGGFGGFGRYALPSVRRSRHGSPRPGKLIRVCPGGRHAWFESSAGPVRKPVQIADNPEITENSNPPEEVAQHEQA